MRLAFVFRFLHLSQDLCLTSLMNKAKLITQIILQLEENLQTNISAALATYEAATGEESQAENEYDTRGLEASYLAGAQAKRVGEIEEQLHIYRHLKPRSFSKNDPIDSTALVHVEHNGKKSYVFLMPMAGGIALSVDGHAVQVITPLSPLGEALVGLKVGDVAIVDTASTSKEYSILAVE